MTPVVPGDGTTKATTINRTIDAGLIKSPVYAVGDYVWYDADHDGIQDAGEAPVVGSTVNLLNADGSPAKDADGNLVAATHTDSAGHYVFDDLPPGSYKITFSNLPTGYTITTPNAPGSTTGNDSNPSPTTGTTPVFVVGPGAADQRPVVAGDKTTVATIINPTIDLGLVPPVIPPTTTPPTTAPTTSPSVAPTSTSRTTTPPSKSASPSVAPTSATRTATTAVPVTSPVTTTSPGLPFTGTNSQREIGLAALLLAAGGLLLMLARRRRRTGDHR